MPLQDLMKEYLNGYRTTANLLSDVFDPQHEGDDFTSATRLTRIKAIDEHPTLAEDLGRCVAWILYHTAHPIAACRYRKSIKK